MKKNKTFYLVNFALLFILFFTIGVNQVIAYKINKALGIKSVIKEIVKVAGGKTTADGGISLDGNLMDDVIKLTISKGVPKVYGEELGVSFDQVQEAINVMRQFDPTYGKDKKIVLTGKDLDRYIDIGLKIACEYCCGVKTLVNKNGKAACGCAHSWAMRGLAAYLIQNHGSEYTNDQILRELARWKGLFFPKQMIKKMSEQLVSGKYTPDTASLLIGIDLPDYGGSGAGAPLPSEIKNLPSMVGGC